MAQYASARERTAHWVNNYSPEAVYSPSTPSAALEGYDEPPSPALSTYSLPPKMILRYNDGRGDVPIPRHQHSRHSPNISSQSGSSIVARPHDATPPTGAPEKIRVLPSRPITNASSSTSSSRQSHTRSKSIPRGHAPSSETPPLPPVRAYAPYSPWAPPVSPHFQGGYMSASDRPAPQRPHYDPNAYHHPPRMGPDGMIYSHSAPPVLGGPSYYSPQPPPMHYASPVHGGERMGRTRGREATSRTHVSRGRRSDSMESDESENTYYMSSDGQKVHVISPSPERSVDTASSHTKVASPWSQSPVKKPFFTRLFGLGHKDSPSTKDGSANGNRKLQRRHSIAEPQQPGRRERRARIEE